MVKVSDRLQQALIMRDMTAAELARRSGVDKGSISNYLKDKFMPKQSAIGAMARALSVSPSWLMGYDVPETKKAEAPVIDLNQLNENNKARLIAYYQALF